MLSAVSIEVRQTFVSLCATPCPYGAVLEM